MKMNWLSLGNSVPHLHVHLIPRYADDAHPGGPIEQDAFETAHRRPLDEQTLQTQADTLRSFLV
jgi:diadenosine tetraphosphate (Ap4A) HIT family hydrolase